jgi:hypothetical protein
MATTLGKRKRRTVEETPAKASRPIAEPSDDAEELRNIFRKAFEAKYEPLEVEPPGRSQDLPEMEDKSDEDDDWDGLSVDDQDSDMTPQVQIVEVGTIAMPEGLTKAEQKAFMSAKVPSTAPKSAIKKLKVAVSEENDAGEKINLKNDLELHRLINESHLLHPDAKVSNNHRQKVLDMRLQALGSKISIMKQEKMPMSHRKGIVAKATDKEYKRRQEAKENGIILEKVAKVKKAPEQRTRGVGAPAIGKFKGGTLKLNKKDLADIKGRGRR